MDTNIRPQLLFFDIDGTLLSEYTKTIPASAVNAVNAARENGHLAIINTGRTLVNLPRQLNAIPFDGFACGCGTRITCGEELLISHTIPQTLTDKLLQLLLECNIEAFMEGTDGIYCKKGEHRFSMLDHIRDNFFKKAPDKLHFLENEHICFDKFVFMADSQSNLSYFSALLADDFEIIDRGGNFYECVPVGFSKATAIRTIAAYYNIPLSDTYAFGDSSNDLSMLSAAAHPVAMKKHAAVLDACPGIHITDTVENNGIEKALSRFGLI